MFAHFKKGSRARSTFDVLPVPGPVSIGAAKLHAWEILFSLKGFSSAVHARPPGLPGGGPDFDPDMVYPDPNWVPAWRRALRWITGLVGNVKTPSPADSGLSAGAAAGLGAAVILPYSRDGGSREGGSERLAVPAGAEETLTQPARAA